MHLPFKCVNGCAFAIHVHVKLCSCHAWAWRTVSYDALAIHAHGGVYGEHTAVCKRVLYAASAQHGALRRFCLLLSRPVRLDMLCCKATHKHADLQRKN